MKSATVNVKDQIMQLNMSEQQQGTGASAGDTGQDRSKEVQEAIKFFKQKGVGVCKTQSGAIDEELVLYQMKVYQEVQKEKQDGAEAVAAATAVGAAPQTTTVVSTASAAPTGTAKSAGEGINLATKATDPKDKKTKTEEKEKKKKEKKEKKDKDKQEKKDNKKENKNKKDEEG